MFLKVLFFVALSVTARREGRGGRGRGGRGPQRPPSSNRPQRCPRDTVDYDALQQAALLSVASGFFDSETPSTSTCMMRIFNDEWPHEITATEEPETEASVFDRRPKPVMVKLNATDGKFEDHSLVYQEEAFSCLDSTGLDLTLVSVEDNWSTTDAPVSILSSDRSSSSERAELTVTFTQTTPTGQDLTVSVECSVHLMQDPDNTDSCTASTMRCGGSYTYKDDAGVDTEARVYMECRAENWNPRYWTDAPECPASIVF